MAATSALCSYITFATPRVNQIQRRQTLVVRCQAEDKPAQEQTPPSISSAATPTRTPTPAAKPQPKVSTKFGDVLAFSGPAPERINGRLAMLGFVTAVAVELASGNDLSAQLANGGFPWFIFTAVTFSVASLVPLFQGETVQSKTSGIMNANAELWNGRFAMVGLVALAFTEYFKGGPLV